jgi:hypothetical protein
MEVQVQLEEVKGSRARENSRVMKPCFMEQVLRKLGLKSSKKSRLLNRRKKSNKNINRVTLKSVNH